MLSGEIPCLKLTKNWYIPLNKYEQFIKNWILINHKNDCKKNVYGQVQSWIKEGLKPRSITRDIDWGVPLPIKNNQKKVLYVWFDAPIGYITASKEWCNKNNKKWESFWKDSKTKLIHFIGKDNIVFHAIIFPIMLHEHNEYILPHNIIANEFLNLENKKISTSKNWAIWVDEYLKDFPNKQDILRYAIIANNPEEKDSNFTWKDFQLRNNSELVGILGNFINRVFILTKKYFKSKVPNSSLHKKEHQELIKYIDNINNYIKNYKFRNGVREFINLARYGNKYLQKESPWNKTNEEEIKHIIFFSIQILGILSQIMEIFMPFTAKKLLKILNCKIKPWKDLYLPIIIPPNHQFNSPKLLFEIIIDKNIDIQLDKLKKVNNNFNE